MDESPATDQIYPSPDMARLSAPCCGDIHMLPECFRRQLQVVEDEDTAASRLHDKPLRHHANSQEASSRMAVFCPALSAVAQDSCGQCRYRRDEPCHVPPVEDDDDDDDRTECFADRCSAAHPAYHDDIVGLDYPKLYEAGPDRSSRRLVVDGLPADTNLMQIVQGLRGHGGIVSVTLTPGPRRSSRSTALVEFSSAATAEAFLLTLARRRLVLRDSHGVGHPARAWLVPTPSWELTDLYGGLIARGATRSLCLPNFPDEAIWFLACKLGLGSIAGLTRGETGLLVIETVSLFEAQRAERAIRNGSLGIEYDAVGNKMRFVPESHSNTTIAQDGVVGHVRPDDLATIWDRKPFNAFPPRPPTREDVIADRFGIEPDQVQDYLWLRRRDSHKSTEYKILGSTVTLTGNMYGWTISIEDHLKLLMANTLHDPAWAQAWDEHFTARNMINLRTWAEYGKLAGHRRDMATRQGIQQHGIVPSCHDACGCGFRELSRVPVAKAVRDWCARRRDVDED